MCVNVFIVNILCVRYVALSLSDFTLINITLISNQQQCSTIRSRHSSSSSTLHLSMMMIIIIIMMSDFIEKESMNIMIGTLSTCFVESILRKSLILISSSSTRLPYHISQSYNYDDDEWTF